MSNAIFCEIQHDRCEQRDLADFAAMTSRENPLLIAALWFSPSRCCGHITNMANSLQESEWILTTSDEIVPLTGQFV